MNLKRSAWALLLAWACCTPTYADLKLHVVSHISRQDSTGENSEQTRDEVVFLSGDKVRIESSETNLIEILHCSAHDRKVYWLDMERKQYVKSKLHLEKEQDAGKGAVMSPGGKVESKTEDTGETRELFGHKAQHLITHIKLTGGYGGSERTQDGWYIDARQPVNRCPVWNGGYGRAGMAGPTVNYGEGSVSFAHSGPVPDGMPVKLVQSYTIDTRTATGTPREIKGSNTWEVLELSESQLDPALFEPPRGFKKVQWVINDRARQSGTTPNK